MHKRCVTTAIIVMIFWFAPFSAATQNTPRTPWGDPDLQGFSDSVKTLEWGYT